MKSITKARSRVLMNEYPTIRYGAASALDANRSVQQLWFWFLVLKPLTLRCAEGSQNIYAPRTLTMTHNHATPDVDLRAIQLVKKEKLCFGFILIFLPATSVFAEVKHLSALRAPR
jgi:hypothetical protein